MSEALADRRFAADIFTLQKQTFSYLSPANTQWRQILGLFLVFSVVVF